jgi:hypothetical protein
MKLLSFLTNPIFWHAYKRNLIAGIALLLIALFGFNLAIGNNPLKRGPSLTEAATNVSPGYCEGGYTFNGGDAGDDNNWTYTNCGHATNDGKWEYKYPECNWSTKQVYDVYQHTGTGEYDKRNYKYREGDCGYYKNSGSSNNSGSNTSSNSQSNTQSGEWRFVYPECDWNSKQVYDVYWHSGTGAYDRRNPHYQEGSCGYVKEWEGPGCNGNRSVWGVWNNENRNQLLRVERDYGVVPGECNNSFATPTPYPTQAPQRTYQDRQECNGRTLVVRRYWSDNKTDIITNYGEYPGYCGVSHPQQGVVSPPSPANPAPTQPPAYVAPQPTITQIQAVCRSSVQQTYRGESVTYYASISTGGTGRLGRVDFRGEMNQSGPSSITVPYNTTGVKYMMATVYDADPRGGSQVVQCPNISVDEPTRPATTVIQPVYQQPVYQQPVYQQPVYQQPYSAPAPTVVYAQVQPQQPVVLAATTNYCPSGIQQQVSGNTVYCVQYGPGANQQQVVAYTYSNAGIISQQVVSTSTVPTTTNAPVGQPQGTIIPTPVPSSTGTSVQCPAGYTAQAYGTTVYCVATTQTTVSAGQNQNNVVLAAAGTNTTVNPTTPAQPKVESTAVNAAITELPRTGLPLAAWGISALLPLGLKFRKGKKTDNELSVNSIWIKRQISKD